MSHDPSPILEVQGLEKRIGKRTLVQDISFKVAEGEIFGFLGPNGAGKTTTIRMLVGLIRPTAGSVRIAGYDIRRHFLQGIRHVGCIVENPELYPYLSGRENLELFARMQSTVPQERIDEVVRLVELSDRINDKVKTYSLGMRQRLGIAQALLGQPKLLILDEPTNGLDPAGIREMRHFIRRLSREERISIFISSHILHEVQLLCDRVAIIDEGKMIWTGKIDQLLESETRVEWELNPAEEGSKVLRALPYVTTCERKENLVITHFTDEKIDEANRLLLDKGIAVTGIRRESHTLEDIFLTMTGGKPGD